MVPRFDPVLTSSTETWVLPVWTELQEIKRAPEMEDLKVLGNSLARKARRVGSEQQMMPMLSSMADHVAVAGLSHEMSWLTETT